MKIIDVIDAIQNYHPSMPAGYNGCDGVKSGDPQAECTGIVCALVPTWEVIRKTAELGCNLLYVHEVSYYMTPDYPTWRGDFENQVYEEKRRFLEENGYYYDYSTEIIRELESGKIQAIIPGEVIEWNVLSYIRDAAAMGRPMACFNIGHFSFEELGAKYAVDWLGDLTDHRVPIQYVPTGDIWNFQTK